MMERVQNLIRIYGLYIVNTTLKSLDSENMDWEKTSAVLVLDDVQEAFYIAVLAEQLD